MMKCMKSNKKKAFTLAEILLSLTVIGIVAAIALPSLLGNANERAWATQKKALHTRLSQALPLLPSLNGYGTIQGTKTSKNGQNQVVPQNITADNAAETFVRDGLSKVVKMTNICTIPNGTSGADATTKLKDCGLPDKIIPAKGGTPLELSSLTKFGGLTYDNVFTVGQGTNTYEQLDTNAAAFETPNGESIIVYYNPNCQPDMAEDGSYNTQPKVCANFVYDLNGIKGPNTVGKDIGFITALYSTTPVVVSPVPTTDLGTGASTTAMADCKATDPDSKIPNKEEAISMFLNNKLLGARANYWTNTITPDNKAYYIYYTNGAAIPNTRSSTSFTRYCIKR